MFHIQLDRITLLAQLAMDAGEERVGVDDPDFGNAVGGVDPDLASQVIGKARVGYFDGQQNLRAVQCLQVQPTAEYAEVRLHVGVRVEPQRGFWGNFQMIGLNAKMPVATMSSISNTGHRRRGRPSAACVVGGRSVGRECMFIRGRIAWGGGGSEGKPA